MTNAYDGGVEGSAVRSDPADSTVSRTSETPMDVPPVAASVATAVARGVEAPDVEAPGAGAPGAS